MLALLQWLYANVFGNLVASLVWAVPGFFMHLHTRRHLRHLRAQHAALHEQLRKDAP